jgi:hypothetical protein
MKPLEYLLYIAILGSLCLGCKSESAGPSGDTSSPAVSIVSPLNASIVVDSIIVIATASDDIGVIKVEFYIDGSLIHTRSTTPWQFNWNLQGISNNSIHEIMAKGYDASNNIGISSAVTVLVKSDTTNPTVSIISPLNNAIIVDSVQIIANAFDNKVIQRVEFYIDGNLTNTRITTPWQYLWDVRNVPDNTHHSILAKVYDDVNNFETSSQINVLVRTDTTRPIICINQPLNNSYIVDSVLITTAAYDNRGIQRVEFFIDGILEYTRFSTPWQYNWDVRNLTPNSAHTIFAKAFDIYNNTDNSPTISVTVNTIPTNGLVAYYPFNGNATDESGNENNGTVYGATLTSDRFGNSNRAYFFNRLNDYVQTPYDLKIQSGNTFSFACWFKTDSTNISGIYLGCGSGSLHVGFGHYTTTKKLWANCRNGTISDLSGNTVLLNNTWYLAVFVVSGTNVQFYLNGDADGSGTFSVEANPTTNARVGSRDDNWNIFGGLLDDIRIYNRALSVQDIQSLYHEGGW